MSLSMAARTAILDGLFTFMELGEGTANFTLYQGSTSLAVFPLTTISTAVLDTLSLTAAQVNSTGTEVAGTANRYVIVNAAGTTMNSGTVGAIGSGSDIEVPTLTVTAAATQVLNALVLRAAADGSISTEASLSLQ